LHVGLRTRQTPGARASHDAPHWSDRDPVHDGTRGQQDYLCGGMMGTERTAMASMALILSYAAVAFAQGEIPSDGRVPIATGVSVTAAVYYFSGYDTDLIRTAGGRPGQENYVAPQVEGWVDRGRLHVDFVNAISYQTGGGASSWNHFNSAEVRSESGL